MIEKFRAKPIEIEAVKWTGENLEEIRDFVGREPGDIEYDHIDNTIQIWNKLENCYIDCSVEHYIIKGVKGEFYPCDPEVIERKYEKV